VDWAELHGAAMHLAQDAAALAQTGRDPRMIYRVAAMLEDMALGEIDKRLIQLPATRRVIADSAAALKAKA